jgi:hypothetical protein
MLCSTSRILAQRVGEVSKAIKLLSIIAFDKISINRLVGRKQMHSNASHTSSFILLMAITFLSRRIIVIGLQEFNTGVVMHCADVS